MELMVDTGLLEPLLPELFRVLEQERAAYFWKMLEVLDRTVQSGRKVSDAVLLSVLFLPFIMDQLEKEETIRSGRLRIGEVIPFVRELVQPIAIRLAVTAGTRHQIEQALETLWRLLEPPTDRKSMWRFVFREHFLDALALFEIYSFSAGKHIEVFRQWQHVAQRVKRPDGFEKAHGQRPQPRRRHGRRRS